MHLPAMVSAGLEKVLDKLLQLDPAAREKLARLHGQVVAIHLQGLDLNLFLLADENGYIQVLGLYEGEADACISGQPLDLLRASDDTHSGSAQLFSGAMKISGNTDLAHQFSNILGNLDIDWEEQLSHLVGDFSAHRLGNAAHQAQAHFRHSSKTLEDNLQETITEEARLTPGRFEMDEFLTEVDRLRDDSERLTARIRLLQSRESS